MAGGNQLREVVQVRIGKVGALVRRPPSSEVRAPVAVVICPGHPASCSASAPLITAIDEQLALSGVPVLRLDYPHVGMSLDENSEIKARDAYPGHEAVGVQLACRSLVDVISWAQKKLSSRIILCGYSFGSLIASAVQQYETKVEAVILISAGVGQESLSEGPPWIQKVFGLAKGHQLLCCRTLYIVGTRDTQTPVRAVLAQAARRSDAGKGVCIEIVKEGLHDMRGKEREVATLATQWIQALKEEALVQDDLQSTHAVFAERSEEEMSAEQVDDDDEYGHGEQQMIFDIKGELVGVVDIDNRIRGGCLSRGCPCFNPPTGVFGRKLNNTCLRCGASHIEHEDKGPNTLDEDGS